MSIEELLYKLENERINLKCQYEEYYDELVDVINEIKRDTFENVCALGILDTSQELIDRRDYWNYKYIQAFHEHNRILDAINIIKERVGV